MVKTIASRRREDGSFAEVGTLDRTVLSGKSLHHIRRRAREWAGGKPVRLEHHYETVHSVPFCTEILDA